jgi:hypothetical protein
VIYFIVAVVRSSVNDKGHLSALSLELAPVLVCPSGDVSHSHRFSSNDALVNVVNTVAIFLSRRRFVIKQKPYAVTGWLLLLKTCAPRFPE